MKYPPYFDNRDAEIGIQYEIPESIKQFCVELTKKLGDEYRVSIFTNNQSIAIWKGSDRVKEITYEFVEDCFPSSLDYIVHNMLKRSE